MTRPLRQRQRAVAAVALACALAACGEGGAASGGDGDGVSDAGPPLDAAGNRAGWAQGYSIRLAFTGGEADGHVLELDRDLSEIPTAFSFGSTHYTHGEVGFAVTDTQTVLLDPKPGSSKAVETQIEIGLNFGLVVGSSVNPVHTDKAAVYPFSCRPPLIHIYFKNTQYRSVCGGLAGEIDVQHYANTTGGRVAGTFAGRLQAIYPLPGGFDACDHTANAAACNKPDRTVEVSGHFGFTLPEKADGGGGSPSP